MAGKSVLRVLITAKNRDAMTALLRRHPMDLGGGGARRAENGAVRVEAYVPEDTIDAIKRFGVTVDVLGDESKALRERQAEVGKGNRFLSGDPVPRGLGRKLKDRDVS